MNWIKIQDEVPRPYEYVLVCLRWNQFINVMKLQYDSKHQEYKWTDWCSDPIVFESVTHWSKLPELPKDIIRI